VIFPGKDLPLRHGSAMTRGKYAEWLVETATKSQRARDHLLGFEPREYLFEGVAALVAEVVALRAEVQRLRRAIARGQHAGEEEPR